jgi:hypothetical protein
MKLTAMAAGLVVAGLLAAPTESQAGVRVAIGVVLGAPAHHDSRYDGYARDTYRHGYDRGFDEGQRRGVKDARHHHAFEHSRDGAFRDGDRGYKGWMGPRSVYADGYRAGYEAGYRSGYSRFAPGYRDDGRWRDRDDWRHDRDDRR